MRHQGQIAKWNDDRGFGFITPQDGGKQVFVHISSFANKVRRPVDGQLVTYELGSDPDGRPRGLDVAFAGDPVLQAARTASENKSLTFAAVFLAFVAGAVVAGKLPLAVLGLYLVTSAVAFLAYFKDKRAAKRDTWRTPEKTLFLLGLIGGWPGALLAQRLLHHKSRKVSFQVIFWGTVILNCVALGCLFTTSGVQALESILKTR